MWVYKLSEFDKIYFLNKNFAKTISIATISIVTISIVTISIATISIPTSYCAKKNVRNSQLLELNGKSFFYIAINNFSSVFFFAKFRIFSSKQNGKKCEIFGENQFFSLKTLVPTKNGHWILKLYYISSVIIAVHLILRAIVIVIFNDICCILLLLFLIKFVVFCYCYY